MRPGLILLVLLIVVPAISLYVGAPWWAIMLATLMLMTVLALGCSLIGWNFFLVAKHHGESKTQIALTFDDGPATYTPAILKILNEEGVVAAFFCIGQHIADRPALAKRMAEEGHIIANHSYSHGFLFDMLPAQKMAAEIQKTNALIANVAGLKPKLFRPPYGVTNPALARAVAKTGMTAIGWSLRSFDTRAKNTEALVSKIMRRLKGGDVILLHDSMQVTAEALTEIIRAARAKGFTFVRLDALLNVKPYA